MKWYRGILRVLIHSRPCPRRLSLRTSLFSASILQRFASVLVYGRLTTTSSIDNISDQFDALAVTYQRHSTMFVQKVDLECLPDRYQNYKTNLFSQKDAEMMSPSLSDKAARGEVHLKFSVQSGFFQQDEATSHDNKKLGTVYQVHHISPNTDRESHWLDCS